MKTAWLQQTWKRIPGKMQWFSKQIIDSCAAGRKIGGKQILYSWAAAIFQGLALIGCDLIFTFGAPPGIAVACLAVAAVIMAFRVTEKDFHKPEQVVWIALAALFLRLEIVSINADRSAASQHEEQVRTEDRAKFQELLKKGEEINQRQREVQREQMGKFRALLSQGNRSINNLEKVSTNLAETSGYASGGTSFPMITPYSIRLEDGKERVGLEFQKIGKYPLFDVHVGLGRAYSVPSPTKAMSVVGTVCTAAEVNGTWSIPLIAISIGDKDVAYFLADLQARNGTWEEVMDVRRVSGKLVSRSLITQMNVSGGPKTIWDIADQGFPAAHRFDVLFPTLSLSLPDINTRQKDIRDKVWGSFPGMGGACSAPI